MFWGLSSAQTLSSWLVIGLFTFYFVLIVFGLGAFHSMSRPRHDRSHMMAGWHLLALFWLALALVALVWAGPAENAFVNPLGQMFDTGYRGFQCVLISAIFAFVSVACMAIGFVATAARQRHITAPQD